jgi:hypothetical protein
MAYLALTDDEIALLRFTCDLFFVEESPLWPLEASQREPADYAAAYHALVDRGIIDPREFRMADDALNRVAPVTECDARLVHLVQSEDGELADTQYFLMDEIAVEYQQVAGKHLFSTDLDTDELVEALARHFLPRRAGGDAVDLLLTPMEMTALSVLLSHARTTAGREVPLPILKRAFSKPPPDDGVLPQPGGPAVPVPPALLARRPTRARAGALVDDPQWDDAVRGLVEKGAARVHGPALWLHSSLADLALRDVRERHTFVRTDFGEEDWFLRETTFLPVEGSLWWMGARAGGLGLIELDGDRLRTALIDAVGPLDPRRGAGRKRRLADLMIRPDPMKA